MDPYKQITTTAANLQRCIIIYLYNESVPKENFKQILCVALADS